mmetsp:Transcript_24588/g.74948  ORF Transcript_24588/g.74948 Transcript_24588/m.74948 type:complete len:209 (-) Transcript_24588:1762-2388(-)
MDIDESTDASNDPHAAKVSAEDSSGTCGPSEGPACEALAAFAAVPRKVGIGERLGVHTRSRERWSYISRPTARCMIAIGDGSVALGLHSFRRSMQEMAPPLSAVSLAHTAVAWRGPPPHLSAAAPHTHRRRSCLAKWSTTGKMFERCCSNGIHSTSECREPMERRHELEKDGGTGTRSPARIGPRERTSHAVRTGRSWNKRTFCIFSG